MPNISRGSTPLHLRNCIIDDTYLQFHVTVYGDLLRVGYRTAVFVSVKSRFVRNWGHSSVGLSCAVLSEC